MTEMDEVTVRTELQPGDLGRIVELHGQLYAREYRWGINFEAYVAEGIGELVLGDGFAGGRVWIAERAGRLVGSIAISARPDRVGQLRYFLVDPDCRGIGLGRRLVADALAFCRGSGFRSVYLWTTSDLAAAAHLYGSAGFRVVEETPEHGWGRPVLKQRYELELGAS